jgi:hypothetical protein
MVSLTTLGSAPSRRRVSRFVAQPASALFASRVASWAHLCPLTRPPRIICPAHATTPNIFARFDAHGADYTGLSVSAMPLGFEVWNGSLRLQARAVCNLYSITTKGTWTEFKGKRGTKSKPIRPRKRVHDRRSATSGCACRGTKPWPCSGHCRTTR